MSQTATSNKDWREEFDKWRAAMLKFGLHPPDIQNSLSAKEQLKETERLCRRANVDIQNLQKRLSDADSDKKKADIVAKVGIPTALLALLTGVIYIVQVSWSVVSPWFVSVSQNTLIILNFAAASLLSTAVSLLSFVRAKPLTTFLVIVVILAFLALCVWLFRRKARQYLQPRDANDNGFDFPVRPKYWNARTHRQL